MTRYNQSYFLILFTISSALYPPKGYSAAVFNKCRIHLQHISAGKNLERAAATAEKLMAIQNNSSHLWQRAGWWNGANIMEAWIDYNKLAGKNCVKYLDAIYTKNINRNKGNFITANAFDDNAWWALAWLKAYDLTQDARYLGTAEIIFQDMATRSWDTICGGGVRWAFGGAYKNAVTNELFMELAARLALEQSDSVKKDFYLKWALKEWKWFNASGMINKDNMINDGLTHACVNNNGITWTYNQGVILGALKTLYLLTSDNEYLKQARILAFASMAKSTNNNGILTEPGGNTGGGDRNQFKGIYIRYLALLNGVLHDADIKKFILLNANYTWQHAQSNDGFFDFNWSGPYTDWSGSAQGSALDLMNAALMQEE
jgi:predicted alpha-1,6-mannanase (GH76 family)